MNKTIRERVLAGDAKAWGFLADTTRKFGGKYQDAFAWVCEIFAKAGKPIPELRDFEEKMMEAEES